MQQVQRHACSAGGEEVQAVLLTVNHHSHLWLEVILRELPESKRLPGCILQHSEGNADGVLWKDGKRDHKIHFFPSLTKHICVKVYVIFLSMPEPHKHSTKKDHLMLGLANEVRHATSV